MKNLKSEQPADNHINSLSQSVRDELCQLLNQHIPSVKDWKFQDDREIDIEKKFNNGNDLVGEIKQIDEPYKIQIDIKDDPEYKELYPVHYSIINDDDDVIQLINEKDSYLQEDKLNNPDARHGSQKPALSGLTEAFRKTLPGIV